jgi:hypothetical protein
VIQDPPDDAWMIGQGASFATEPYQDDAGIPAASVRLEFRPADGGYGALEETFPYSPRVATTLVLPTEGARWCWRITHLNTLGESSAPSAERCFRTDWTPPTSPAFVDAGAVVSSGTVFIDLQPAADALSGVQGYDLMLAPAPAGPFSWYPSPQLQLPLVAYVGEGQWRGWVLVVDQAYNDNNLDFGSYEIPITVTASSAVPTPEAPAFEDTMTNGYGDALVWDAGIDSLAGVTHVVASFCELDAGCQWRHGFHTAPVTDGPRRWLQVSDEGTMVARIALVKNGQVGPWSPPSAPLLVDRTPPPKPPAFAAAPAAARTGPITLTWGLVVDDLTGLAGTTFEETELRSGAQRTHFVHAPAVTLDVTAPGDGVFQFRAASIDRVGNQSDWTMPVVSVIDSRGPVSLAPLARAQAFDGGALVSLTWPLPTDALSGVSGEELSEQEADGGAQVFGVTGLSASRVVPPGRWTWSLRGTDALGNVGAFSPPSNVIVVTSSGVAVGPVVVTTSIAARCGEPLAFDLVASGDAPLTWALSSGPAGLAVDRAGHLTWTPPPGTSGSEQALVQVFNPAGPALGTVELQVTCDASQADAGTPPRRTLVVGCGCASLDALSFSVLLLALLRRRGDR